MTDLDVTCTISRPGLGLPVLHVQDPAAGYRLIDLDPGEPSLVRQTVRSPFRHGRFQVAAVYDEAMLQLAVRVTGATATQLNARVGVLMEALRQRRFEVTWTVEGVTHRWRCDNAVAQRATINRFERRVHMSTVTATIPRHPIPLMGVI